MRLRAELPPVALNLSAHGEMAERPNALVLKTRRGGGPLLGSNPSLPAFSRRLAADWSYALGACAGPIGGCGPMTACPPR